MIAPLNTRSRQILFPSEAEAEAEETRPATAALKELSWLPRREEHRQRTAAASHKIPPIPFSWTNSVLSKQRNDVFDMSALYNASQRAEGCMEFPPIKWSSEGEEEEAKGLSSQRCSSYTEACFLASDITPLRMRSFSTSSLNRKRSRSSKKSSSHRFLVRSIALDANLSLLESPCSMPSAAGSRNATFGEANTNSMRLEECMKILKGSPDLLGPTKHSCKKQRSRGSFQILQE
jgi:hypothetical protein